MRDGWQSLPLAQVADVQMGQSPPGSTYNTDGDGLPFLQGSAEFGELSPKPVKWCSAPKKVAGPGDLLLSVRAPVGDLNFADRKLAVGRGLAIVRGGASGTNRFLALSLEHSIQDLLARSGGGMFSQITKRELVGTVLSIPPLEEQKRIVDLIGSLDVYIELCRSRVEAGVSARRALVEALLGQRDETWNMKSLGEIAALTVGKTPPRRQSTYWTDDLRRPFCTIADMDAWAVRPTREGVSKSAEDEGKARRFRAGTLLMSFKLTIGRVGFAAVDLFPNEAIVGINPVEDASRDYLAIWLDAQDLTGLSGRAVKGRTLNRASLEGIPVAIPPLAEQKRIVEIVSAADDALLRTREVIAAAQHLRDGLLHDLLSGEHEIPDSYDALLDEAS